MVRDKDGITAALLFAEVVARLKAQGRTVFDRLDDLARVHGVHVTRQWSSTVTGPDGPAHIRDVVEQLRRTPPTELAGHAVTEFVDLQAGGGGGGLPPTEGIVIHLGDRIRVIVRPSGTEPKVKVYFEVVEPVPDGDVAGARERGQATVDRLKQAMALRTGLPT
jgi:phosphomannomutase